MEKTKNAIKMPVFRSIDRETQSITGHKEEEKPLTRKILPSLQELTEFDKECYTRISNMHY